MEIEEIKDLIRSSLKKNIAELRRLHVEVPKDFKEFRRSFSWAISSAGAPENLCEVIDSNENSQVFSALHAAWSNISAEIHNTEISHERREVWNESMEFYLKEVIDAIDPSLSATTVRIMKR